MMDEKRLYGKYRGTVVNNIDPKQMGRIQVMATDASNVFPTSWATPCVPVAGLNMGVISVPPVGSGVWVEFEQGKLEHPIWVGGFWGSPAELPALARSTIPPGVPGIALQTALLNGIVITDVPGPSGGILLVTKTGAMISISDAGIVISNGKGAIISMTGPAVDINAGALTIT